MPCHMRIAAERLGITGTRGSWERRLAEGITSYDGVTVSGLGEQGSWMARLAVGLDRLAGEGSFLNRIAPPGPGSAGRRFADGAEAGGLTPLWSADFVNGAYTLDGAPSTVGGLFGEDLAWSEFNPATAITADGLIGSPVLIGAAATHSLAGATYVVDLNLVNSTSSGGIGLYDLPTNDQTQVEVTWFLDHYGIFILTNGDGGSLSDLSAGVNRLAITLAETHAAVSLNGGAAFFFAGAPTGVNTFAIAANPSSVMRAISAYPQQADGDLPDLSAP